MKTLKTYLEELFATPGNTIGMGNVQAPTMDNSQTGSGDIVPCITGKPDKSRKRRKKFRRYKI